MIKEGNWPARAISGASGTDDKQYITARVDFEILGGPDTGSRITYNGRVDARSAPYVAKDLKAVGWKCRSLDTLAADVEAAQAVTTIEVQHKQTKDGARSFAVVRSIGRGPKPLAEPSKEDLDDANAQLRAALAADGEVAPTDDIPF